MAAYVMRGAFGDWEDTGSDVALDAGGTDYPTDYAASPGYSAGDQGGGGIDWTAIGATALNAAASVVNTMATQSQINAGVRPVGTVVQRPGTTAIAAGGTVPSSLLVVGGLGALALLLMKK